MSMHVESLESRRLLAGVTLLIHGHEGTTDGWVEAAANAIADRAGGTSQTGQYVMKIAENSAGRLAVTSFKLEKGKAIDRNSNGEAVILVDWTAVDDGSESTKHVGQVVTDYLSQRHGSMRALSEVPIHMIGHSRGASMVSAIAAQLGEKGIWVDHVTYLDPHPVDGGIEDAFQDYGDEGMKVWNNTEFADNYWREDGLFNFDPDGESVGGAHNQELDQVNDEHIVSAHMAVTSYYHGTIELDASNNRDNPIFSSWYGNTADKPARDDTGYLFSRIGGGKRPTDGLSPEFGGTAKRSTAHPEGTQSPNVTHIRPLDGQTFASGTRLSLRFVWQDRDGAADFNVFMDPDENPYNGNNVKTMRRVTLGGGDDVTGVRISALTDGVKPGKYYIGVQASDAQGQLRIAYSAQVTVTAAVAKAASFSSARIAPETASSTPTKIDRIAEQVLV